jgi:hypothetical membrane protein
MSTITTPRGAGACSPEARVTRSLLGYGMVAGPFYVVASVVEGLTRPGFNFARHDWSLLALGRHGWIHVTVLVLTGVMVMAVAVGIRREARAHRQGVATGWLLGAYGLGMVGAGIFVADPAAGFPLGTPEAATASMSWHGALHFLFGGVGFLAVVGCCLLFARRFFTEGSRNWAWFSVATGVLFLAAFAGIATGGATSSAGVLAFTAAVLLVWAWLFAVSRRLFHSVGDTTSLTEVGR